MKNLIKKLAIRLFPELASKTYFPRLARVIAIPDPPSMGGVATAERPRYAVDVRLLTPTGEIDEDMPLVRDVPVALPGAAPHRGFAALPQPGTIVEIAFAFGRQDLPFVRSVLPDNLALPVTDGQTQRWQFAGDSYIEVGNGWTLKSPADIEFAAATDIELSAARTIRAAAAESFHAEALKVWLGTGAKNSLDIIAEFMATTAEVTELLKDHRHDESGKLTNEGSVRAARQAQTAEEARLEAMI